MTGTFNPAMTNCAFIFPGGPRRSYHRSFGTRASPSRISAICLLAAESSKRPHAWNIRYQRWSEWYRLRQPDRFVPFGGVVASGQTPHLEGWLFEGDPGVEPGNVTRAWKVFVHTSLAPIRLGRYITLPSLFFGLLDFDRIIRHYDAVLVNIAGNALIFHLAFDGR